MTNTTCPTRPNKYAARCVYCDGQVPAGAGILDRKGDAWIVTHKLGYCTPQAAPVAPVRTGFAPTAEQEAVLALFGTGESMIIQAGAGAGKTSTLRLCAEWLLANRPTARAQYLAFNKAIVSDVSGSMPTNVQARTAHSLAYAAVGKNYSRRMETSRRMASETIAARLGIDPIQVEDRTLAAGFLAGHVMKALTNFCQSADPAPTARHFSPIDSIDSTTDDGTRRYEGSNMVARTLLPALERAWADIRKVDGVLPFTKSNGHAYYLKIWQLSAPVINADVIMFDEAQDASPVMAAIVAAQTHAQRVYVGDSAQAIYEFTGAVDALAQMKADGLAEATLSQSFRFGPAIAARANLILDDLDADLRLVGTPSIPSTVGTFDGEPDAILARTNACAIDSMLAAREAGVVATLVGQWGEMIAFARAARDLQAGRPVDHTDLGCFSTWADVQQYVADDAQGSDLALQVRLIDKYTADTIIDALTNLPAEADADLIVSTAHKSKGREWNRVRIADDFAPQAPKPGEEPKAPSKSELRLRYVACTRAKLALDATALNAPAQGVAS